MSLTGCCTRPSYLYTVHTWCYSHLLGLVQFPCVDTNTATVCGYTFNLLHFLHYVAACGISTAKAAAHKATDSSHLNNFTVEQELIRQQVRGLLTNTFEEGRRARLPTVFWQSTVRLHPPVPWLQVNPTVPHMPGFSCSNCATLADS